MAAEPDFEQITADRDERRARTDDQIDDHYENWLHGEQGLSSLWAAGAA